MSNQVIKFYRGLPGSGKSTLAKAWVDKDATNRVRVNKDDLRNLLHNGKYSKGNENQILDIQDFIIVNSLKQGKSVAFDNTHLVNKHLIRLENLLKDNNLSDVKIEVVDLTSVSPEEAIKRDLKRENSVGSDIIWRMYWDHIATIDYPIYDHRKLDAIIVDVDGTLAQMEGRSPYEWNKVSSDSVRTHIRQLVNVYVYGGYKILIVTGRDGSAYNDTHKWLEKNTIHFDNLFSRLPQDNRKDYIVKREIYEKHIKPYYNVCLVVDDRPQVIREWRRLGLPVINANPIDREF